MLSVYAVVLLLAVGFVAVRLHGSYREINRANSELAELNESLEQRVSERTNELAGTLSDLKESQVQLVQAEKMSSLGQFVAGISHEINTPLLYLANNAELIQERLTSCANSSQHCTAAFCIKSEDFAGSRRIPGAFVHALKEVKMMLRDAELEASIAGSRGPRTRQHRGLSELTEMAQSLKDFSRLDRAPVASFDVNAGLDKTLVIAKNIVKHKATCNKFYGEVPEIQCSPSQINQVFLNIITNAAQAIETHGEIVITTRLHDERHVAIRIADTGCGIPEENLAQDSRSVLHDEGSRHGHRPRTVDRRRDHSQPRRPPVGRVEGRQGLGVHRVLPIKGTAMRRARPPQRAPNGRFHRGRKPLAEAV